MKTIERLRQKYLDKYDGGTPYQGNGAYQAYIEFLEKECVHLMDKDTDMNKDTRQPEPAKRSTGDILQAIQMVLPPRNLEYAREPVGVVTSMVNDMRKALKAENDPKATGDDSKDYSYPLRIQILSDGTLLFTMYKCCPKVTSDETLWK